MTPLDSTVDLSVIVNPWQAVVAVVLIFAVLIWPQLSARQTAKRVEKTLTTNNGGSTVKDALDRMEAAVATIQTTQQAQGKKLDDHIEWSEGYVKETGDKLDKLSRRRWFSR